MERFDLLGPLPAAASTTVLEASAGTGKTFALAGLVTRYIAEGAAMLAADSAIEEISAPRDLARIVIDVNEVAVEDDRAAAVHRDLDEGRDTDARALLVDADLGRRDRARIVGNGVGGQRLEELDAENPLARDVGRVAEPYRLAAMYTVRAQEQVGAFEKARFLLGIHVAAHARLERDLAARLDFANSHDGVGEEPARIAEQPRVRRHDRVERRIVVHLGFERDVGHRFPGGVDAWAMRDTRAADDQTRAEAACALVRFHVDYLPSQYARLSRNTSTSVRNMILMSSSQHQCRRYSRSYCTRCRISSTVDVSPRQPLT